jgi:hypothetical protein
MSDRASKALAEARLAGDLRTYDAISKSSNVPLTTLHHRARGRRPKKEKDQSQQYLTPSEEKGLERYIKLMSDLGIHVRIKFLPSLAFNIARQRSITEKSIKPPGKNWPQGFQKRHPGLMSRRLRPLDWQRHEDNIYDKITRWFEVIRRVLQDPAVRSENVYNMDETGVMLCMLGSIKVLVSKDDPRDYRGAGVKRTTVTTIECISADGRSLLPMIIWPATTHRSNWTTYDTPGWHYACSESGFTDSRISFEWLTRVFDPQTKERANKKPRVLICDGFGTHETLEILEFCFDNNIILCRLPSHTSHKLQPCDVGVFAPLKSSYRERAERLWQAGTNKIGLEHFTSLYSPARESAFTKRNITAAWAACGLFPFNPERVLRHTPKPLAQPTVPNSDEVNAGPGPQDEEVLHTPVTPVTPVSAEAFTSLHNLIKRDAQKLDETGVQRLQRHVGKLVDATQACCTERDLYLKQYQFAIQMNNEAKVRRSTRALKLGDGRVMSKEELDEARAARAAKDDKKNKGKGKKRGRKRKSDMLEPDEPDPDPDPKGGPAAKEAVNGRRKRGRKSKRAVDDPEPEVARRVETPVPWRAPVARMI